jgi:hypothetical protein
MIFIAPSFRDSKFTCPHCSAISLQRWDGRALDFKHFGNESYNVLSTAKCDHCNDFSVWLEDKLLHPNFGDAPQPNPDLPESVKEIYIEAASISSISPRGSAALLRLAVQILCRELGEKGENINADIASLVKKGLPDRVQKALDIVRVTGNNAVHPGQIDVDDPKVANNLFDLLNVITEYTISMPNRINGVYDSLPDKTIQSINKRDKKA